MKAVKVKASKFAPLSETQRSVFLSAMRSEGFLPIVLNDVYIDHLFRPERIQIFYGGSGSGKSDAKATELLLKCLTRDYCRVMFIRKVYDTIRMSQFQLFKDLIARYSLGDFFHVTDHNMTIKCKHNGNMLFARGLDDVSKVMSVADVTDIWIEEPIDRKGSITPSDFTELNRRLRTEKASNHIHLTFNPISSESWIYDYFFRSNAYSAHILKTTYLDNHFSPKEQELQFRILSEKNPEEYKVYALGEWGKLKRGLVFPEYDVTDLFPTDCKMWGYGLDWGFYPDPTAMPKCGIKDGVLFMDEVIYQTGLTSGTRAQLMQAAGVRITDTIIADPNKEAIAEMKTKGYGNIIGAVKGPGSVKAGLKQMEGFKIVITKRSKNIKNELDNYAWLINKATGEPTGEPIDAFNHSIDAARYWVTHNLTQPVQRTGYSYGY